jgi:NAD(P)-dependent dehydrogenase (short-subunit alcohol dehydrogenase family)
MIRVWVPGCSTGEEAYSTAMLITEQAEAVKKSFDLKLFATDVAEGVLSSARAGLYPGSIALDAGEDRLERFFEMQDDTYSSGSQVPLSRARQPKELAPAYVLLASDEASYISGAVVPVTGGKPML